MRGRTNGARNAPISQTIQPSHDPRQRGDPPFFNDFSIKLFFAEGKAMDLVRIKTPAEEVGNDPFVLHAESALEVSGWKGMAGFSRQTFPTFLVMRGRIDNYSIPIEDRTPFHSRCNAGSAYRACNCFAVLSACPASK